MKPIWLAMEVRRPVLPKKWSRKARSWHTLTTSDAADEQSASGATRPRARSPERYASIGWAAKGPDEPWPAAIVRRIASRSSPSENAAANSGTSWSSMSLKAPANRRRLSATVPDPARDGSSERTGQEPGAAKHGLRDELLPVLEVVVQRADRHARLIGDGCVEACARPSRTMIRCAASRM